MPLCIAVAAAFGAALLLAQGSDIRVERVNPPFPGNTGGPILARDSLNALSLCNDAFRTTDGGKTWVRLRFSYPDTLGGLFYNVQGIGTSTYDTIIASYPRRVWLLRGDSIVGPMTIDSATEVTALFALDSENWFAAAQGENDGFLLFHSSDRGKSWQTITRSTLGTRPIILHFFSRQEGVVLLSPMDSTYRIYFTSDGGDTWQQAQTPPRRIPQFSMYDFMLQRFFQSSDSSIWYAEGGALLRSTDRGRSWDLIAEFGEEYPYCYKQNIIWLDSARGFVSGANFFGGYQNTTPPVMTTTDGGKTWFPEWLPNALIDYTWRATGSIAYHATAGKDGTLWFATQRGSVYRKRPGNAWEKVIPSTETLTGIQAIDDSTVVAWGLGSVALKTDDRGTTWFQSIPIDTVARSTIVVFTDRSNGIFYQHRGVSPTMRFFRTSDGGKSWQPLPDPPSDMGILTQLLSASPGVIIGVGAYGGSSPNSFYYWISTDGGQSWRRHDTLEILAPLRIVRAGNTLLCTDEASGVIYSSVDSGITWRKLATIPLSYNENEKNETVVAFDAVSDKVIGVCIRRQVYNPDTLQLWLLLTTDGGWTWSRQLVGFWLYIPTAQQYSLTLADASRCVIMAPRINTLSAGYVASGFIYTGDGGKSWYPVPRPRGVPLSRISCDKSPDGTIWCSDDYGVILRIEITGISRVEEEAKATKASYGLVLESELLLPTTDAVEAVLYSVTGSVVGRYDCIGRTTLDMSDVAAGFYMLVIRSSGNRTVTYPLIVLPGR